MCRSQRPHWEAGRLSVARSFVTGWRSPSLVNFGRKGFSRIVPLGNAGRTLIKGVLASEFCWVNSGPVTISNAPPFCTY